MPDTPHISWSSDRTLRVETTEPLALAHALRTAAIHGVLNITPTSHVVQITVAANINILDAIRRVAATPHTPPTPRLIEIPTCYDADFAPDLADAARLHNLTITQLIDAHTTTEFTAAFLGFAPGFAYLTGFAPTPRLDTPRPRVAPGSVALGGPYAGVYPFATPGGWRIIGRTPLRMFDPAREQPSLLQPGDRVRFVPVSRSALMP